MSNYFFAILTMFLATALVRLLPLWIDRQSIVQESFFLKSIIKNFPVAILTSLIMASVLIDESKLSISTANTNFYATLLVLPLIYFSKNIALIIVLGLLVHFSLSKILV